MYTNEVSEVSQIPKDTLRAMQVQNVECAKWILQHGLGQTVTVGS